MKPKSTKCYPAIVRSSLHGLHECQLAHRCLFCAIRFELLYWKISRHNSYYSRAACTFVGEGREVRR